MYRKIFPAELDFLYEMLEFIKSYENSHKFSKHTLDKINLATEEALVNIINYGYPQNKKGFIEIICEHSKPPGVKIIIKDQGVPFNPIENALPNPPSSSSPVKPNDSLGGYGIYIYIGLMDRVEYQRINDGNILTMTKYF